MEKLKVGVLGLRRGVAHLRNMLRLDNVEVIGVCDRLPVLQERAAQLVGDRSTKILTEYEELLGLKPDAVVVATNGKMQVEHSIQAMEAGCAVLSEVPGAYTLEEVIRLRAAVEHTGCFYMFAENACFWDFMRYWRKWVIEGRLGPVPMAEGEYAHYLPNTLDATDGTRLTPSQAAGRKDVAPIWRADQPPIQYLTHDLGPLLEMMDDRCVSVTCRNAPWWNPETPLRSDGQVALLETAKGSLIRILVTLSTTVPSDHRFRLLGTQGSLEWFLYEGFTRVHGPAFGDFAGWSKAPVSITPPGHDPHTGHGGSDYLMAQAFVDAVLEGKPSPIDVYRMADYTLPGITAAESARLGGVPVSIPNLHRGPYAGTHFWDVLGLPEEDPEIEPWRPTEK